MKIKSLRLQNFMLFKKFYKVFEDKDVIGIVAEYKNSKQRSNKGGKTTIIEAIRYALTGDSRAAREVDLIHHGEDVMMVEIEFDNGSYVKRGRDSKNHGLLEVDKITNSDEAQKRINELIGHESGTDFTLTRFFLQQDINQFMETQPRQKQKYLMQWLNNNHWLKLERAALDDLNAMNKKLLSLKSKHEVLSSGVLSAESVQEDIGIENFFLEQQQKQKNALEEKISELRKLVLTGDEVAKLKKRITSLRNEISERESELEIKKTAKNEIAKIEEQLNNQPKHAAKTNKETEDLIRLKIARTKTTQSALEGQISLAETKHTGVCPILQQSCDRIALDTEKLNSWKVELKEVIQERKGLNGLLAEMERAREAERHQETLKSRLGLFRVRAEGIDVVSSNLGRLRADLDAVKNQIKSGISEEVEKQLEDSLDSFALVSEIVDKSQRKIGSLRERLKIAHKTKKRIDKIDLIIAKKQKRIQVQKFLTYMFGRNGIPSQEIENGFEEIEDETNFVLRKFGLNLSIMFEPMRELPAWEPACVACGVPFVRGGKSFACLGCGTERQKKMKDELTVKVLEDGEEHDFSMESGGGKTIISFSNRLALTRLKQRKNNSEFNVLFLDEPDSALDKPNKRAFMDLVTKTLTTKFGIEQIFWITHDITIQEYTPHVLKVVRNEKHSTAVWL